MAFASLEKPKDFSNFPLPPWKVSTNFRHFQVVQVYFLTQQLIIITVWINPKNMWLGFFVAWIWLIGWFMICLIFSTQPWFKIMVSWCFMVSSALTYQLRFETSDNWPMDSHGFPLREFLPCETEPPTTGHGTLALIKGNSSCKFTDKSWKIRVFSCPGFFFNGSTSGKLTCLP